MSTEDKKNPFDDPLKVGLGCLMLAAGVVISCGFLSILLLTLHAVGLL